MRTSFLRVVQIILSLAILAGLIGGLWHAPTRAQDAGLTFRIARVESENTRLRARVSQLEAQVNRISRSTGGMTAPLPTPLPPVALDDSDWVGDPMFDRLATLVIETRQDVFVLQDRLTELETQIEEQDNPVSIAPEND